MRIIVNFFVIYIRKVLMYICIILQFCHDIKHFDLEGYVKLVIHITSMKAIFCPNVVLITFF